MPARRRCLSCGCALPSGTLRSMRRPRGSTPSPRACEGPERRAPRIMKKPTLVNHPPTVELPAGNRPLVAPIYQTVKFEFDTLEDTERYLRGERPGFFYTRASNPTTRQLEQLLAQLQGREECLVTASGVAAISHTLLTLTKKGDHVLCFIETYNPSRYLIRRLLGRFGVAHTLLSIEDLPGIERTLTSQPTRLVYFESPTNPVTRIADIAAITRFARASGALTVMDNTFAGFHQHGGYDVDVFVHSLTKYASGAGDVMGGAVIARAELIRAMRTDFGVLGGTLDPHAAFLIQRGLKTYFVRYKAQAASAARDLTPEQQKISALTPGTIRLSIGLEDQEDLIEDLDRALAAALG